MSPHPCPSKKLLFAYLGDELDSAQSKRLERHVEECQSCQQRLAAESQQVTRTGELAKAFSDLELRGPGESEEESEVIRRLARLARKAPPTRTPALSTPDALSDVPAIPDWLAAQLGEDELRRGAGAIAGVRFAKRYQLKCQIHASSMSVVLSAYDLSLKRDVVIKIPAPNVPESGKRFVREARVVAELEHPNIVPILDIGKWREQVFVTYKHIAGRSLSEIVSCDGALGHARAVRIVSAIANALQHVHEKDVYHRDVKSANIVVTPDDVPVLLDFGLAVRESNLKSEQWVHAGTLPYMSPEQVLGLPNAIDGRADIYALGIVLYELVSGKRPFDGDSDEDLKQAILNRPARPPRQIVGALPQSVEEICLRCLEKNPVNRFHSAAQLEDALNLAWTGFEVPSPAVPPAMEVAKVPPEASSRVATGKLPDGLEAVPRLNQPSDSGSRGHALSWGAAVVALGAAVFAIFHWIDRPPTSRRESAEFISAPDDSNRDGPVDGDRASLGSVNSFSCLLLADGKGRSRIEAIEMLRGANTDLVIVEPSFDRTDIGRWTSSEIGTIRSGKVGRKVLAYLSLGEIGYDRPYWNPMWDSNSDGIANQDAPDFLALENEGWNGSYRVKYWDPQWKEIVLGELDRIVGQGFDGVLMDPADAFEFQEWSAAESQAASPINPATGKTYRQDMIELVFEAAGRGRRRGQPSVRLSTSHRKADFFVVVQNAFQLLDDAKYVRMIDAIVIEDLLFDDNEPADREKRQQVLRRVARLSDGQPVLLVERVNRALASACRQQAKELGFPVLITTSELDVVPIHNDE